MKNGGINKNTVHYTHEGSHVVVCNNGSAHALKVSDPQYVTCPVCIDRITEVTEDGLKFKRV